MKQNAVFSASFNCNVSVLERRHLTSMQFHIFVLRSHENLDSYTSTSLTSKPSQVINIKSTVHFYLNQCSLKTKIVIVKGIFQYRLRVAKHFAITYYLAK